MHIMKIYINMSISCYITHMEFKLNNPKPVPKIVTIRKPSQILGPCGTRILEYRHETTTFFGVPQVFPLRRINCEKIKEFYFFRKK